MSVHLDVKIDFTKVFLMMLLSVKFWARWKQKSSHLFNNETYHYHTSFQLQKGNMVWYMLSGFFIQSRQRRSDHIIFLELNNIFVILQILSNTPFYNGIARVISRFFICCRIWKNFAPLKRIRSHQRIVYSKWRKPEINSNYVENLTIKTLRREKNPDVWKLYRKNLLWHKKQFKVSWHHSAAPLTSCVPYIRLQP